MPEQFNFPIIVLIALTSLSGMLAVSTAGPPPGSAATAEVQHCSVLATRQCTVEIPLQTGEQVVGTASTGLNSRGAAELRVTSPSNVTVYKTGMVNGSLAFLFTAFGAGAYNLHFDNLPDASNGEVIVSFIRYPPADC